MVSPYYVPIESITTEQVIKKSRFVCTIGRARSRQLARTAIDSIRRKNPQASHVCWAFLAGSPDSADRGMSDDGEPRGTAGRPMLSVLEYSGLGELWTTVTRYYGGVKLGPGGLARAYSSSVRQTISQIRTREKVPTFTCKLIVPYYLLSAIKKVFEREKIEVLTEDFQEQVELTIKVPSEKSSAFTKTITDIGKGTIPLVRI